jgi:hypothetical protein
MKILPLAAAFALVIFTASPARVAETSVTPEDVLSMMARVPAVDRSGAKSYRWDQVGDAKPIAKAIARSAPSWSAAAELTVYAVREGGLRACAAGDSDKQGQAHSFGTWQISDKRVPVQVACDPMKAAPIWLAIAASSRKDCADLPPEEQLAELASGNCAHGRAKARERAAMVASVLAGD